MVSLLLQLSPKGGFEGSGSGSKGKHVGEDDHHAVIDNGERCHIRDMSIRMVLTAGLNSIPDKMRVSGALKTFQNVVVSVEKWWRK